MGALASLVVWAFNPNVLAYGHLVATDIAQNDKALAFGGSTQMHRVNLAGRNFVNFAASPGTVPV